MISLGQFVNDFAWGLKLADSCLPTAVNARTKVAFQPGIGPHSEAETVKLVMTELSRLKSKEYSDYRLSVPYPTNTRQKCDLCLGAPPAWLWVIEIKMLRLFGTTGS